MTSTPGGPQRKAQMLEDLLGELDRTRERRANRRRVAGSVAAILLICAGVFVATTLGPSPTPAPTPIATATDPRIDIAIVGTAAGAHASWVVSTSPDALARATVPSGRLDLRIERLGDAELLDVLADAGRPTGLVRTGGRVVLTEEVVEPFARSEP